MTLADERERAAAGVLRAFGLAGTVRSAGADGEIAMVCGAPAAWRGLPEFDRRETVQAIKALGYRYVALDLDPPSDRGA